MEFEFCVATNIWNNEAQAFINPSKMNNMNHFAALPIASTGTYTTAQKKIYWVDATHTCNTWEDWQSAYDSP